MIGFIKGKVHALGTDYILLDHDGIGFRISFMYPERLHLGEEYTIYTYQNVREDEISLYGFLSLAEYDLFTKLISVKGLGPKIASNILARSSVDDLLEAIATNDIDFIKKMPGVGNKMASQIILDLKGKLVAEKTDKDDPRLEEVREALKALGYKANEFANILKELAKKDLSRDQMIKEALKALALKR